MVLNLKFFSYRLIYYYYVVKFIKTMLFQFFMGVDEALKLLEQEGFEIKRDSRCSFMARKINLPKGFYGISMRVYSLDEYLKEREEVGHPIEPSAVLMQQRYFVTGFFVVDHDIDFMEDPITAKLRISHYVSGAESKKASVADAENKAKAFGVSPKEWIDAMNEIYKDPEELFPVSGGLERLFHLGNGKYTTRVFGNIVDETGTPKVRSIQELLEIFKEIQRVYQQQTSYRSSSSLEF